VRLSLRSPVRIALLIAAVAGVSATLPCSTSHAASADPADVVRKYCQLDYQGHRLTGTAWKQVAELVAWENESGWDTATVVAGFRISAEQKKGKQWVVTVVFDVLGTMVGDSFHEKHEPETVAFYLTRSHSKWRIQRPVIMPHVSIAAMRANLRELLNEEIQSSGRKAKLQAAVERLEALERETGSIPPRR
jgi:hypothetical protein